MLFKELEKSKLIFKKSLVGLGPIEAFIVLNFSDDKTVYLQYWRERLTEFGAYIFSSARVTTVLRVVLARQPKPDQVSFLYWHDETR